MSQRADLNEGWYSELLGSESLMRLLMDEPGVRDLGFAFDPKTSRVVLSLGMDPSDSKTAKTMARDRIATVYGLLKVVGLYLPAISEGDPFFVTKDGPRNVYATIRSGMHARDRITSETVCEGVVQAAATPKPYLLRLHELAESDPNAALILRLLAAADADTWTGLYRLKEVIEAADGGFQALVDKGWTSKAQALRFNRTANSPSAAGDAARHGVSREQAPSKPMTLEEGRAYLMMLMQAWFSDRLSNGS